MQDKELSIITGPVRNQSREGRGRDEAREDGADADVINGENVGDNDAERRRLTEVSDNGAISRMLGVTVSSRLACRNTISPALRVKTKRLTEPSQT